MEADWCVVTLQQWGKPQIFNTNQGSQFTGDDFVAVLQDHQIAISWDGRVRALDNIFVERFWRTLKYEDIYLRNYQTGSKLRAGLVKYFQYYNNQRPHQSLGYRTPARVLIEGKKNNTNLSTNHFVWPSSGIDNGVHYMSYKGYQERGLLNVFGIIESAHRTALQKRLKRSGQRWSISGAQHVLNLHT